MSARFFCMHIILTLIALAAAPRCPGGQCPFPTLEIIHRQPCEQLLELVPADLNGDGLDDLAALRSAEASADIYLNTGGAFEHVQNLFWAGGPETLAIGDWNGDGHDDLFLATFNPSAVQIALNDGDGTFTPFDVLDQNRNINHMRCIDLDEDGSDELLLTLFSDTQRDRILRFRMDADGDVLTDSIATDGAWPFYIALGDVDRDGDTDIAVSYTVTRTVRILHNQGAMNFSFGAAVDVNDWLARIHLADVTGDGAAELFVEGAFAEPALWFENGGTGGLELAGDFASPEQDNLDLSEIVITQMADSAPPLILGVDSAVHLFASAQPGTTEKSLVISPRPEHLRALHFTVGNFDGAGGPDIVTVRGVFSEYNLFLYANRGVGLDCNNNGIADGCDIVGQRVEDCNFDGMNDACAIASGLSTDCDANGVPDDCQTDCNFNGVLDACDVASGAATDYDGDGVLDECEFHDCNGDGVNDIVQTGSGAVADCNANFIPDECELIPDGWGYDDGSIEGTHLNRTASGITAVHFEAGEGLLITAISAATVEQTVEAGFPVHLYVWDDPDGDGQPDDAVLLAERVAPIQVMNEAAESEPIRFNHWPIDPVFVSGSLFIGFGVELEVGNSFQVLLHDFSSFRHDRRTWFAEGIDTAAFHNAEPHPNAFAAPALRVITTDCNLNAVPDACDLLDGTLTDADGDHHPDECPCGEDLTGDHSINSADVVELIGSWGPCNGCRADFDRSGIVDVFDLFTLLSAWGSCESP